MTLLFSQRSIKIIRAIILRSLRKKKAIMAMLGFGLSNL